MSTKVWMNFDPEKVDLDYLIKRFRESGVEVEAEAVSVDDTAAVLAKAKSADVVIAAMEK